MENEPTLGAMIGFSWKASKEMLFPFRFNRWFKILVIIWLAAAGVQGYASNFKMPAKTQKIKASTIQRTSVPVSFTLSGIKKDTGSPVSVERAPSASQQPKSPAAAPAKGKVVNSVALAVLMTGGIFFAIGFGLVFVWLNCRFNFVLLDILATRAVSIREPFRQNKEMGDSYFKWSLAFLAIGFGVLGIVGALTVFLMGLLKAFLTLRILIGIAGGFVTLALFLGMIFTGMVARDFVLPIMYREKILMKESWGRFLRAGTFHIQKIIKYVLVVMGLAIIATVIQSIVSLVVALVGLVAGGLLVVPGIILIKAIPFIKIPLMVLGAGVGLALILAVVVVIGMVLLPVCIFFRMFALTYMTRLYPDCDLLNFKTRI